MTDHIETFKGADGDYYWRVRAANHEITAVGGEGFKTKRAAQEGATRAAGQLPTVYREQLPWETSEHGGPLGRHIEHDERSRGYAFTAAEALPLRKILHGTIGGILDQARVGACTGFATAKACNSRPIHDTGDAVLTNTDGLDLYHRATILDGFPGVWPPDDTGSSGLAACKGAAQRGLIKTYRWAFSLDDALQALMRGCILIGINWYEGFDRPAADGLIEIAGQVRGGHELCVRGYDPTVSAQPSEALLWIDNSWTTGWGLNGRCCMKVGTLAQLLSEGGDVAVPWE